MGDNLLFVPESSLQQPTTPIRQQLTSKASFHNLVSHWDLNNLESLGLFYAEKPVDINTLLDKSLSYNSQISHLSPNLNTFIIILERFLNFNVSLPGDYSEGEQREDRQARWTNEIESLGRCKIEADKVYKYEEFKVIDNETEIDNDLLCLFDSIMASVRDFYIDLKKFMVDIKLNCCTGGSYRELCRAFLKTCGLGSRYIRGRVYKFLCSITDLLDALKVCRNISDAYEGHYTTLFSTFAELCCLNAKLGIFKSDQSTWKNLGGLDKVISQPDIRLFKYGVFTKSSIDRKRVVSVVEVKKSRHHRDLDSSDSDGEACKSTSSVSSVRSRSSDTSENAPKIELLLNRAVLGQHAGELLLDLHKFVTKDCYTDQYKMPGMIVKGTMVFVTVLEISRQHYIKLAANKELEDGDKAIIYYSRPFNILNERDRNVLIESFVRLNNMQ
ncbi:Hypothetical predicted protein [Mytilus galloprovincialis]|uniref:Uncharacterized protein n=1 Tax=Mytilus galloprovincialis TaxID=29158 RepID=A0A8B6EIK9_MYTGA|nr:Hypothetical predicted protein [Mytilus galloprovincialis]